MDPLRLALPYPLPRPTWGGQWGASAVSTHRSWDVSVAWVDGGAQLSAVWQALARHMPVPRAEHLVLAATWVQRGQALVGVFDQEFDGRGNATLHGLGQQGICRFISGKMGLSWERWWAHLPHDVQHFWTAMGDSSFLTTPKRLNSLSPFSHRSKAWL